MRQASSHVARHAQHFLWSPRLCAQLVDAAEIGLSDYVLDIGAGTGALTAPLSNCARRVLAIEPDERLAANLRQRFANTSNVEVMARDFRGVELPKEPFSVVANLPFFLSSEIFRRLLDDPTVPLQRANLIIEWGFAIKRTAPGRANLLNAKWHPWFELQLARRLDARVFEPMPSVDAAVVSIRRREVSLLPLSEASAYQHFLNECFAHSSVPMKKLLRGKINPNRWTSFAHTFGLPNLSTPQDLDVWQWSGLYAYVNRRLRNS